MSACIYTGMQTARNGTEIPVFSNGRTFFSTYNPERDAEAFVTAHKDAFDGAGCILIGGIGNGLHLASILEAYPAARIIAFEADEAALLFARSHLADTLTRKLEQSDTKITLTTAADLATVLPARYIPSLDGNFAFAAVRSWSDMLGETTAGFLSRINGIIADISADYSVQAQFGKLWHRNILLNLSLYDTLDASLLFDAAAFVHAGTEGRKAAIIGAGPSLDKSIHILAENRSAYCIFATDTTFCTLKAAGITPDFVVTVDSQQISEKHFIGQDFEGTVLASDLTGNSSIIKHAADQNARILLFHNNHPLSQLVESCLTETGIEAGPFPIIDSGAGTVLHAATDLARKLGFTEPVFFGADFAYSDGKPYTKGTYLEKQYYAEDARTGTAETAYSRLMYRTPLVRLSESVFTTDVLSRYRQSLETYLENEQPELIHFDEKTRLSTDSCLKMSEFIPWYLEKLQKKDKKVLFSILPLAAWYKKKFSNADIECVYAFAEQQTANVGRIQCRLQKK